MKWLDSFLDRLFEEDICDGFQMERIDALLKNANISPQEKQDISNRVAQMSSKEALRVIDYLRSEQYEQDPQKQFKKWMKQN
tara:strand:- start:3572 stop:3817 length:246 start_codon:yes stop_codon:yes gene_type:complete